MKYIKLFTVLLGLPVILAGCGGGGTTTTTTTAATTYMVSVTVTGLASGASLVLQDNGGDDLSINANATYAFAAPLASGASYSVTIKTPPANLQTCLVGNGAGIVNGANVSSVTVACADPSGVALAMTMGIKQLKFAWTAVTGSVDHYELWEDPDGSGYAKLGSNIASNTTSYTKDPIAVHQFSWANAKYKVRACSTQDVTCATSYVESNVVNTTSSMLQAIGYFKASNTTASDNFGYAVAVSGDGKTLAVGAYKEGSAATGVDGNQVHSCSATAVNCADKSGAVYVFSRDTTTGVWTQQAYIKASNTGANDNFGWSVALSDNGNTLAVGAPGEASASASVQTNDTAQNAGAAYVYTRTGTVWSPALTDIKYVKASAPAAYDLFGYSVALNDAGNVLAVGSVGAPTPPAATGPVGKAYVFSYNGSSWVQQHALTALNSSADDKFGWSVALDNAGTTLAVGAINANVNVSGAVYIFTAGSGWIQQATYSGATASEQFGSSLALKTNGVDLTLAVGADLKDGTYSHEGAVYVYHGSGATWTPQTGSPITVAHTKANDFFGTSVALSNTGASLVVGADGEGGDAKGVGGAVTSLAPASGAVYIFAYASGTWGATPTYIKALNTQASDFFGSAVAVSSDGKTLAVGAHGEDSGATGIIGGTVTAPVNYINNDAVESGAMYLY